MGFTLIELLVVISIIGILSTIIFANITSARSRVRDAIRVSDVKKILSALESYKLENGHYPCTSGAYNSYSTSLDSQFMRELVWGGFLSSDPHDPLNEFAYMRYAYKTFHGPNEPNSIGCGEFAYFSFFSENTMSECPPPVNGEVRLQTGKGVKYPSVGNNEYQYKNKHCTYTLPQGIPCPDITSKFIFLDDGNDTGFPMGCSTLSDDS